MFENAPASVDLSEPSLYINRELSLLEFNRRVLAQSMDDSVPLLERLRCLAIFSSNLDEFFEVRVAGLKREVEIDVGPVTFDGLSPQEILRQISQVAHDLVDAQYQQLNEILLPALDAEGVRVLRRSVWTPRQRDWTEQYFREQCLPVLTPVGLDPAHPFPNVQNKGLNFIVSLEGDDAFGRDSGVAVVQVSRSLPRVIEFPPEVTQVKQEFAMISSVIHAHVGQLFPNMTVTGCHQFRVTRNSDLWVDEERSDDLLSALQGELHGRPYGAAVRLEVADNCSESTVRFLLDQFDLNEGDRYQVKGPVNLHRLAKMIPLVDRPDLRQRHPSRPR